MTEEISLKASFELSQFFDDYITRGAGAIWRRRSQYFGAAPRWEHAPPTSSEVKWLYGSHSDETCRSFQDSL